MIRVEIWSDVVCPFCYIGKRHLEAALKKFERRDRVRVVWKSFELDRNAERGGRTSEYEMLSKKYGMSLEQARQSTEQVARRAAAVGLRFDFDRVVPANSFDAHRLAHLAAKHGLQDAAHERLFAAHFTEGLRIDDLETLRRIGVDLGHDPEEVKKVLEGDAYASDVRQEEKEAFSLGVRGVPFFLFNRRNVISGAQPVELFTEALRSASDD
ncbi:MAG TPA: DsbA family oxidoreductase [Nitrospiria bacterium]|jgi:predicted DsbA family dithiol-disulfide isomerase|nr:DsbA family oxidoreductase [Nitrospiria bacterium]